MKSDHRIHLTDAAFHLKCAERALERAADDAPCPHTLQTSQRLAGATRKLMKAARHTSRGGKVRW